MSADEFRAHLKQPAEWRTDGKPRAILDGDEWRWTTPPQTEQDVVDACLHIATWYGYKALQKAERGQRLLWYRTSTNARARNAKGTPDYHVFNGERTLAIEFKGPKTPVADEQRVLNEAGGSYIIGPDDLNAFRDLITNKENE
jgi:hypothetical protein